MMNYEYSERIEQYLLGKLDKDQQVQFEKEMLADPELAKEVELQRAIYQSFQKSSEMELRDKLDISRQRWEIKQKHAGRVVSFFRNKYLVAASVALLIMAGGALITWLLSSKSTFSGEALFAENYHRPDPPNYSVRDFETDSVAGFAFREYQHRDFVGAIKHFTEALQDDPSRSEVQFYLGITYLESDENELAIQAFKQVIDDKSIYLEEARWYLALCYLKIEDMENTRQLLQVISGSSSLRKEQAAELLEAIEK